jgi:D-glycero-D-manno-heptose 1,7-bisphosphate phosphatase
LTGGAPAIFLDRDGVLNELVEDPVAGVPESPLHLDEVRLMPGAAGGVLALRRAGYTLVCVTNQPAAAKGKVSLGELEAIQGRVAELLGEAGVTLDAWRMCPHHPDGVAGELAQTCDCRKPAPGMLLQSAHEMGLDLSCSWMIGDTDADVQAGAAAGCRTVQIEHPASAHKRLGATRSDLRARDLADAAAQLLALAGVDRR